MAQPYVGQILLVGFNFAPINYAFASGALQAISQNTALFSIVGTTYGGDGVTTFGLPNLQNRVVNNVGQGPGLSNYNLGQLSGSDTETLTIAQMPAHNHHIQATNGSALKLAPANGMWLGTAAPPAKMFSDQAPNVGMSLKSLASSSGNQPHNNVQPVLGMNYVIALFGIYPSRN